MKRTTQGQGFVAVLVLVAGARKSLTRAELELKRAIVDAVKAGNSQAEVGRAAAFIS